MKLKGIEMKIVKWGEPWATGDGTFVDVKYQMSSEDAIKWMKYVGEVLHSNHPNYPYETDQDALDDFLTVYWASIEDE
jgi:hypothetical protein